MRAGDLDGRVLVRDARGAGGAVEVARLAVVAAGAARPGGALLLGAVGLEGVAHPTMLRRRNVLAAKMST
jgi:hypothetical protein